MSDGSFSELRNKLDGKDNFVNGGHGIIKTAGATRHAERMKRVPVWALDDAKLKELINLRFPKANIDPKQRALAARMVRLIYLYYRVGLTTDTVAEELKMTRNAVECSLKRLNKGMSKPFKPSHRPKKADRIDAPNEVKL